MRSSEGLRSRSTSRTNGSLRAFTLVEVLIAIAIGALLLGSVVSSTRAIAGSRKRVEERATRTAEARRAMDLILAALRDVRRDVVDRNIPLILGRSGGPGGSSRIDMQVMSDRTVRADSPESDQQEIAFFLKLPGNGELPSLMCRRDHGLDEHMDDGGVVSAVARGIVGLGFEYYFGGDWFPDWPSTRAQPPQAIRVTLTAATDIEESGRNDLRRQVAPDVIVLSSAVVIHISQQPPQNDQNQNKEQNQKQNQPKNTPPPGETPL